MFHNILSSIALIYLAIAVFFFLSAIMARGDDGAAGYQFLGFVLQTWWIGLSLLVAWLVSAGYKWLQ